MGFGGLAGGLITVVLASKLEYQTNSKIKKMM
jgi:hypothetical protein